MQLSSYWIAFILILSLLNGFDCQIFANPCQSFPCENGATCKVLTSTQYQCTCRPGYTGSNCQTFSSACNSNPCGVGGLCNFNEAGLAVCYCLCKSNIF